MTAAALRLFEMRCALVANELARCVAAGLTSWAVIAPRLRARAARAQPLTTRTDPWR